MHELSIVASLFEILEEKAREQNAVRITAVKLRVGRLSGVVPDLIESAFDTIKKGTLAEGSCLEIEVAPFDFKCRRCGGNAFLEDPATACASCGSTDIELVGGMDLVVEKIEIEVADP
ncbi:MAG: hydrogenase maturation nickel metallochaperone HypA [Candidatus Aminicenantales bacterium]